MPPASNPAPLSLLQSLLSDRWRREKIAGLLVILILTCVGYYLYKQPVDAVDRCLRTPGLCDGRTLVMDAHVVRVEKSQVIVRRHGHLIALDGPLSTLETGWRVRLLAIHHSTAPWRVLKWERLDLIYPIKYGLSLLGMALGLLLFFRHFRINTGPGSLLHPRTPD
ncbi:MAG: hypothetical protein HQL50_06735 [Magnetococcales bacterium]|nr:hypothetical protein [Magnetococcales bacterium]